MSAKPASSLTLQIVSDGKVSGEVNLSPRESRRIKLFAAANETSLAGILKLALIQITGTTTELDRSPIREPPGLKKEDEEGLGFSLN